MGELKVLDRTGDTRIMWDPERPAEVEVAKKAFDEAKKKGHVAYSVTKKGDKDEVIRDFDPSAGKIIMAPALRGG